MSGEACSDGSEAHGQSYTSSMPAEQPKKPGRRTQAERTATTRALLLTATISTLAELGFASTTTTIVAERAQVSRGAQLHHYKTKAELLLAAAEHLHAVLTERVQQVHDIKGLWRVLRLTEYVAWLELCVGGRTDEDLADPISDANATLNHAIDQVAGTTAGDALRGMAMRRITDSDWSSTRESQMLKALERSVDSMTQA